MDRPSTSKPRGVCKYYLEPRGCFAGNKCKFLHCELSADDSAKLTPYDKAKTCRFFAQGFCKRGDKCWFQHVLPDETKRVPNPDDDPIDAMCSICFEKPLTYGLLSGCSHVFCLDCIRQWRSKDGKTIDVVDSGVNKKCPMCRSESRFVTPSSSFYKQSDTAKDAVIAQYMGSMARVPCRYFQASKGKLSGPSCPFGRDCFYQHRNDDGTEHTLQDRYVGHGPPRPWRDQMPVSAFRRALLEQTNATLNFPDLMVFNDFSVAPWLRSLSGNLEDERRELNSRSEGLRLVEDLFAGIFTGLERPAAPDRYPPREDDFDQPPPLEPISADDDSDAVTDDTMPELQPIDSSSDEEFDDSEDSSDDDEDMPSLVRVIEHPLHRRGNAHRRTSVEQTQETRPPPAPGPPRQDSVDSVPSLETIASRQVSLGADPEEIEESTADAVVEEAELEVLAEPSMKDSDIPAEPPVSRDGPPPFSTDGRGRVIAAHEGEVSPSLLSRVFGVFGF